MNQQKKKEVISAAEQFVKELLAKEPTGHDWHHVNRVRNSALKIASKEGADPFLVELIALLHDVSDHKLYHTAKEGEQVLNTFLIDCELENSLSEQIKAAIAGISFKGLHTTVSKLNLEGQVVQDADRLDALGAIGIARTFAYGGKKHRMIFDPEERPEEHESFESYKSSQSCTINHFYEKLLHLKDRLNTSTAREMAQKRHAFMEEFLAQFYSEWNGKQ